MRNVKVLLLLLLLLGCEDDFDRSFKELKSYVAQIKKRTATPIDPIPTLRQYQSYAYPSTARRDPFQHMVVKSSDLRPDRQRKKQPLEQFPLDTLTMVGFMASRPHRWALILAPDDIIYRVRPGDYLGQQDGRVTQVDQKKIQIHELISVPGGWEQRATTLNLQE